MGSEAIPLNTVLEDVDKLDIVDQQYVSGNYPQQAYREKAYGDCVSGKRTPCAKNRAGTGRQKISWRI